LSWFDGWGKEKTPKKGAFSFAVEMAGIEPAFNEGLMNESTKV